MRMDTHSLLPILKDYEWNLCEGSPSGCVENCCYVFCQIVFCQVVVLFFCQIVRYKNFTRRTFVRVAKVVV